MVKIPVKTAKDKEKDTELPAEEEQGKDPELQAEEGQDIHTGETTTPEIPETEEVSPETEVPQDASEESAPLIVDLEEGEEEAAPNNLEALPSEDREEVDELTLLAQQLQTKEQEVAEHYEARLRLQAEFDNFKKRKEKENADFRKYANEGLLQDILPVVDDFERAIAAAEQTHKLEDFLQGVELIFSKFLDVLQKKGVKEIEAEPGQVFNPAMHEAVTQIETDDIEEGAIAAVFQKGYYLHDRVLRAPKVGVAKAKE